MGDTYFGLWGRLDDVLAVMEEPATRAALQRSEILLADAEAFTGPQGNAQVDGIVVYRDPQDGLFYQIHVRAPADNVAGQWAPDLIGAALTGQDEVDSVGLPAWGLWHVYLPWIHDPPLTPQMPWWDSREAAYHRQRELAGLE